jgi:hypothetical protein
LARQRQEDAMMAGWFAARYVWAKELPPLASELGKLRRRGTRVRQTNDGLMFEMTKISALLGVPIQERAQ